MPLKFNVTDIDIIPVHILTGFLGSGKTTLLTHYLSQSRFSDTAVLVNEFGEIGLDNLLVEEVADDVVLLSSGCICCTVRDDLATSLIDLFYRAQHKIIPKFSRAIIETTGIADPLQIAELLLLESRIKQIYRLSSIVTVVDGFCGQSTLKQSSMARKQVATSDLIVLSKTDLTEEFNLNKLRREIDQLNPRVHILNSAVNNEPNPEDIFIDLAHYESQNISIKPSKSSDQRHDNDICTFTLSFGEFDSWERFVDWIDLLLSVRGNDIFRVKGWVAVKGQDDPIVIQCVQHTVYPPSKLSSWPGSERNTNLVFIAQNITKTAIQNSLESEMKPDFR